MLDALFPANLIRIKDFTFEDGTKRDKYLFVLLRKDNGDSYIIHSLTTSRNKYHLGATGLNCYYDRRISTYFYFPAGVLFGDGDFFFEKDTYILFNNNVTKVNVHDLLSYSSPNDPFSIAKISTLKPDLFIKLLKCAAMSIFTPQDIKEELLAYKDTLL